MTWYQGQDIFRGQSPALFFVRGGFVSSQTLLPNVENWAKWRIGCSCSMIDTLWFVGSKWRKLLTPCSILITEPLIYATNGIIKSKPNGVYHEVEIPWEPILHYWPFVRGIHQWLVATGRFCEKGLSPCNHDYTWVWAAKLLTKHYLPFVRRIHQWLMDSAHKGQVM